MTEEHIFAQYVRILGKGKKGSRSLTQDEAYEAMRLILADAVEPVQLGAFLMLMRVKEESPQELAGFVRAARDSLTLPNPLPQVDLDWSSYAGKRRHLPWFTLSALLLAENGISILMHGIGGRKHDRVYTHTAFESLGIPASQSLDEAAMRIRQHGFAFLPLERFQPKLQSIIDLRDMLGLRSPVHTLSRMLNPFQAPYLMQGIFHPGYKEIHQQAALLLKQPHAAVLKGEGGEIERNPDASCQVLTAHEGVAGEEQWPAMFEGQRHMKDETMDVRRLAALWRGDIEDEYGLAAVTGTAAIALKLMGRAESFEAAEALARATWDNRPKEKFGP
ncbi:MAG: glycosyl transferase family protein [Gammaproteobacteria bacterium]